MATSLDDRESCRRLYCGHCHELIPKSSFYRHRNRYYNHVTGEWSETDGSSTTHMEGDPIDVELLRELERVDGELYE